MSGNHWSTGTSGDFATAANWSLGVTPGATDTAIIDAAGIYQVTLATLASLSSLQLLGTGASLLDTGTLDITGALALAAGQFTLAGGGVVAGGTLSAAGGTFDWAGGTLSGTSYEGVLALSLAGESLTIANGLNLTGAGGTGIGTINAAGGATMLDFLGTQTLNNALVEMGNPAGGATSLDFGTLTLSANTTLLQLGGGTLNSWSIDQGSMLVNNGTIATGQTNSGADIVVTSLVNTGLISATSPYGGFSLQATDFTNTGTINAGGGVGISTSGSFDNAGVINITGGVAVGSQSFVNTGHVVMTGSNNYFAFEGGIGGGPGQVISGAGTFELTGSLNQLRFLGSEDFTQGTIILSGSTEQLVNSQPYPLTVASMLTFGSQAVVEQIAGTAILGGGGYAGSQLLNQGLISAQGAGGTLSVYDMSLVNDGTFAASNGGLLQVQSVLTGSGALDLATGGELELLYGATGQTVNFLDTSVSILKLDSSSAFSGTISNFGAGNVIDLASPNFYTAVAATAASWSGGMLDVTLAGGSTLALAMAGNYSTATFGTKSDGSLGTDITLASGGNTGGAGGGTARSYAGTNQSGTGTEGSLTTGTLASFTDNVTTDTAGQLTALINWADGTSSLGTVVGGNGSFGVIGSHDFTNEGSFVSGVTITNNADASSIALAGTFAIGEADSFTAGAAVPISVTAGNAFSGTVANFTDSYTGNSATDLSALISWGDGSTSSGTITDLNGTIAVTGTHLYATAGSAPVTVSLNDIGGTATGTASSTATVAAGGGGTDGAISVLSVSETGVGVFGVVPANLLANSNTATGSGVTSVTASSSAASTDAATSSSVGVGQTVDAAWTGALTGTATFNDNWSTSNVNTGVNNAMENFGLGPNTPGYSNASFTFTMATAGTFGISWNATESGTDTFGFLNMVAVVDGGKAMQVSPLNASAATPTGSFTGTLAAGVHTIALQDWSNYSGAMGTATGTFSETLNLTVTPSGTVPVTRSYGGTGTTLSSAEGSALSGTLASFTDSATTDTASLLSATINWGDGTSSLGTITGGNGTFSVVSSGHAYADEGSFVTSIVISNSADGSATTLAGGYTATEADMLTAGAAAQIAVAAGATFSGAVVNFTDSYSGATAADFTATINWGDGSSSAGTITDVNGTLGVTGSHAYAAVGKDSISVTLTDANGTASATAGNTATVSAASTGKTYNLTKGDDTIQGSAGNDVVVAKSATLTGGDVINGGGGTNILRLSGGGVFNIAAPDVLANMQIVQAQEGSGASAQTVTLREFTALNVNVLPASTSPASAGITIYGAQNTDTIHLGAGQDIVYLGAGEALKGGTGTGTVHINSGTAGNSISGGTGAINLVVDGGGDVILGKAVARATSVSLTSTTNFTANAMAGVHVTGSAAGGDVITLGAASQSVVGGGANETVLVTASFGGAAVSGLGAGSTLEITTGGKVALNAATSVAQVKLDAASQLTLNGMGFITAIGATAGSTITAGAANQTLSSQAGSDTLIGYAGGGDLFSGTAAGLAHDLIRNFLPSDVIDIRNLGFAGASLSTVNNGTNTALTISSGGLTTHLTLAGVYGSSGFHLASDGANGLLLTHS